MTRKDYELIAEGIVQASLYLKSRVDNGYLPAQIASYQQEGICLVAHQLSDELFLENHRFDQKKFLTVALSFPKTK